MLTCDQSCLFTFLSSHDRCMMCISSFLQVALGDKKAHSCSTLLLLTVKQVLLLPRATSTSVLTRMRLYIRNTDGQQKTLYGHRNVVLLSFLTANGSQTKRQLLFLIHKQILLWCKFILYFRLPLCNAYAGAYVIFCRWLEQSIKVRLNSGSSIRHLIKKKHILEGRPSLFIFRLLLCGVVAPCYQHSGNVDNNVLQLLTAQVLKLVYYFMSRVDTILVIQFMKHTVHTL